MPPPDAKDVGSDQAQPDSQPKIIVTCPECGTPSDAKLSRAIKVVTSRLVPWVVVGIAVVFVGVMTVVRYDPVSGPILFGSGYPGHIVADLTINELRERLNAGPTDQRVLESLLTFANSDENAYSPSPDTDSLHGEVVNPDGYLYESRSFGWPITIIHWDFETAYTNLIHRTNPTPKTWRSMRSGAAWSIPFTINGIAVRIRLIGLSILLLFVILLDVVVRTTLRFLGPSRSRGHSGISIRFTRASVMCIAISGASVASLFTIDSNERSIPGRMVGMAFPQLTRSDIRELAQMGDAESTLIRGLLDGVRSDHNPNGYIKVRFEATGRYSWTRSEIGWPVSWIWISEFTGGPFAVSGSSLKWDRGMLIRSNTKADPNGNRRTTIVILPNICFSLVGLFVIYKSICGTLWLLVHIRFRKRLRSGNCTACGYDLTALTPGATGRHAKGE